MPSIIQLLSQISDILHANISIIKFIDFGNNINLYFLHNHCPFFSFLGTLETFLSKVLADFYRLNEHQIIKIKLVLTIKALNKMLIRFKKE